MEYRQAVRALYARMPARIGPTLERIQHLVDLLDHPELTAPSIHLTGTNGKNTSARMMTMLLTSFGVGAGRYISPHVQDVRERIALATRVISEEEFAEVWTYLEPFLAEVDRAHDEPVTFHEALTAMAFSWFAELPVDAQVVEVGMGGSWDATNVVDGAVAVVNHVGIDHAELGETPLEIAREKAGIIKPGAVVVSQAQDPDVLALLTERTRVRDGDLLLAGRDFDIERRRLAYGGQLLDLRTPAGGVQDVLLPLHGRYQAENAASSLAAVEAFLGGRQLDETTVRQGFAAVTSPGRMEVVRREPLVLLDGAHNPDGARALAGALLEEFVVDRRTLVVACMADKDIAGILSALAPATGRLIVTRNSDARSASGEQLRKEAEAIGLVAEVERDVPTALRRAIDEAGESEAVVVTGSIYTVGEAREMLMGPGPA